MKVKAYSDIHTFNINSLKISETKEFSLEHTKYA